jgi:hypothetical protein
MAGFADALGFKQVTNWLDPRRNALIGLGAGIASGQDLGQGVALGLQYGQQGRQVDDANAIRAKEEAERQRQIAEAAALKSKYAEFFTQQGRPDIARGIADGIVEPGAAYMDFIKPKEPTKMEFRDVNGDIIALDPYSGKSSMAYDGPDAALSGDPYTLGPGQMRFGPDNKVVAEGPAKPTGSMDAATKKELFEAEEAVTAGDYVLSALDEVINLNDKAYDGPGADMRGDAMALFGNEDGVATSRVKNLTTELALSQLKTIFGSMPTEGERKILLELQGSVNQPRPVRAAIYKRAKEMAERRIADNKRKAQGLRSGEFFQEGYGSGGGDWEVVGVE